MAQSFDFFTALFRVVREVDACSADLGRTLQVPTHRHLQPLDKVDESVSLRFCIANLLL